jgi:hypothetical protein
MFNHSLSTADYYCCCLRAHNGLVPQEPKFSRVTCHSKQQSKAGVQQVDSQGLRDQPKFFSSVEANPAVA